MPSGCVVFRVDAGRDIGLGHLQRCLSLAAGLRQAGSTTIFLTNGDRKVQGVISSTGSKPVALDGVELGTPKDLTETVAMATHYNCDAVIVDSYRVDDGYLGNLRAAGFFVVAIDDLARYPFPCQLVVNGNADASQLPYGSSSGDTRFLLGPQYALLRQELWDVPDRTVRETVNNVLVTLGSTDPHNLMPQLLGVIDQMAGNFTVTVVVGPFFENRNEVETVASRCQRVVRMVDSPDSVRELMLEADLAVSAGGQTLYELAAMGTPAVALQVADNQSGSLSAIAGRGVVRMAGCVGDPALLANVEREVQRLLGDVDARKDMTAAARRLGMGQGAIRVAEVFNTMRSRRKG
jgi:UDP-2,4-diacetamido-2,4,6-trideoxy-beta-L-altropyranose hydrolase